MPKSDMMYFVELQDGTTKRCCWVDKHVKAGDQITLKNSEDPTRHWDVLRVFSDIRTVLELDGQRGWHVGGLE